MSEAEQKTTYDRPKALRLGTIPIGLDLTSIVAQYRGASRYQMNRVCLAIDKGQFVRGSGPGRFAVLYATNGIALVAHPLSEEEVSDSVAELFGESCLLLDAYELRHACAERRPPTDMAYDDDVSDVDHSSRTYGELEVGLERFGSDPLTEGTNASLCIASTSVAAQVASRGEFPAPDITQWLASARCASFNLGYFASLFGVLHGAYATSEVPGEVYVAPETKQPLALARRNTIGVLMQLQTDPALDPYPGTAATGATEGESAEVSE